MYDFKGPKISERAGAAAVSRVSAGPGGQSKISQFFSGPFRQAATAAPAETSARPAATSARQAAGSSSHQLSHAAAAAINRQQGRGTTPGI